MSALLEMPSPEPSLIPDHSHCSGKGIGCGTPLAKENWIPINNRNKPGIQGVQPLCKNCFGVQYPKDKPKSEAASKPKSVATSQQIESIDQRKNGVIKVIEDILILASKNKPLSIEEIAQIIERTPGGVTDNFLNRCSYIPWLFIESKANRHQFIINEELKNLCDWYRPLPELGNRSVKEHYTYIRKEITRRRQEAHDDRKASRWNPESINKLKQHEALNFCEIELDKLKSTGLV